MTTSNPNALTLLEDLQERGLIFDCTNKDKLLEALNLNKKVYLGIDPTFHSLHLGHYLSLILLKHFKKHGFEPIVIFGDMTSQIGDPSFRNNERPDLSIEQINQNISSIKAQVFNLCGEITTLQNLSFYQDISIPLLLRETTKNITVSSLLAKDFLKDRLKTGLTVTEFLYPIFQAYDFYYLYKNHNVAIQIGGSDQWGNITVGIDLIKKKESSDPICVGLTFPLLVDSNNKKFGKSEGNCCFLSPQLTKPYFLYQYLINVSDQSIFSYLPKLSTLSLGKIKEILTQHQEQPSQRLAQKALASEVITNIYSPKEALKLQSISNKLFSSDLDLSVEDFTSIHNAIPTIDIKAPIPITQSLIDLGFAASLSEARRLIKSKCIYCFDSLIDSDQFVLDSTSFKNSYLILKKGKKDLGLIYLLDQ